MRAFAHAKFTYDAYAKDRRAKKPPLERTPMVELVEEIDFGEARKEMGREPDSE